MFSTHYLALTSSGLVVSFLVKIMNVSSFISEARYPSRIKLIHFTMHISLFRFQVLYFRPSLYLSTLRTGTFKLFKRPVTGVSNNFNPLNAELNPICYLLALLGAHHFLHVSRIRVKSLTRRLLMSYIYGAPILDVSRSHTTTHHSR